jgi:DNA-binding XRE family transcriptional regulator
MKRRQHHPDQLTLSLGFIRRIICSASADEISASSFRTTRQNGESAKTKSRQNGESSDASGEKESFRQSLVRQRKRHGFTQADAAEILQIGKRTLERWESEEIEPSKAVQIGAIAALRASKTAPGKAKLEEMKQVHHLDWEQGKGWRLRVTVDVGKKVVGKRISLRLGTYVLEEAMQRKKVIVALLTKLGLTVRQRVQKRRS